jgi:hypothetical protein
MDSVSMTVAVILATIAPKQIRLPEKIPVSIKTQTVWPAPFYIWPEVALTGKSIKKAIWK